MNKQNLLIGIGFHLCPSFDIWEFLPFTLST